MKETNNAKRPAWAIVVQVLLLLWNLMGLSVFAAATFLLTNREALEKAGMEEPQIDLILSTPSWVTIAFGVSVVFGVLGCIALLARKKAAIPLLVISLLGVLVQYTHMFFLSNTVEVMGLGLSPVVIVVSIALIPFALLCNKKGWLSKPSIENAAEN